MKEDEAEPQVRFTGAADWSARREGPVYRALTRLDRTTGVLERPVEAAGRAARLNPLHHTGPIAVFLFVIVFATGVYVTMFYRFGFEASYTAVDLIEGSFIGRVMRAAHRYSSIAFVVVSLLHGWRTFVQGRFQKPRRTAWVTGVVMVAIVWLIGVTGYWLIWDERAQVLNEALRRVMAAFSGGLDFMLDNVLTGAAGTGWPFLLLLFLIHFILSLVVAVLTWYHVRHEARPRWLPTGFWVALIGGSLLVASIVFPAGMLPPLDSGSLVGPVNVDPFFLFLLPLAVTWPPALLWGLAVAVAGLATALPWLMRRRRPAPVSVIDDRCIGCTWCASDCPYDAIEMVDTPEGKHLHLAVIVPERCTSCGICLGSCPTKALSLDGREPGILWDELAAVAAGGATTVTISCQRQVETSGITGGALTVPCVGMAAPSLLESAVDLGLEPELVGCPEYDCTFLEGSAHAAARLDGTRSPRLRRAYRDAPISITTVDPGRFEQRRPPALPGRVDLRKAAPLALVISVVALASVWISRAVYDVGEADESAITIALDHRAGLPLVGEPPGAGELLGTAPRLSVTIDGVTEYDELLPLSDSDNPNTALLWQRFTVPPGPHALTVTLADDGTAPGRVLFDDTVAMEPGESLVLQYRDQQLVVASDAGEALFHNATQGVRSGCVICHSLEPEVELVGPSLAGVATRAATRVPGLTAEEYLHQSIVDPDAFVVPGYPAGQMLQNLGEVLTPTEVDQLVAFLMTLEEPR